MRNALISLGIVIVGVAGLVGLLYLGILTGLVPLAIGAVLLGASLGLAFGYRNPTVLQQQMMRSMFALALGALASAVPGILNVDLALGTKATIAASGAIAVWLITFFFVPARDKEV